MIRSAWGAMSTGVRIIAVVLALAILGWVAWRMIGAPRFWREQAAVARVERANAEATAGASADALQVVRETTREFHRIETTTKENDRAILASEGAAERAPGVAAALRHALCLRDAYRGQPDCAAVPGDTGGIRPAGADAGSGTARE